MPTPRYAPNASLNRMLGRADVGHGDGRGLVNRYHEAMSTPAARLDARQLETLFTQSPSADELELLVRAAVDLLARAPNASYGSSIVSYVHRHDSVIKRDPALREKLVQTLRANRAAYAGSDDEGYVRNVLGEAPTPALDDEESG
jgi:hypothetical protein